MPHKKQDLKIYEQNMSRLGYVSCIAYSRQSGKSKVHGFHN